MPHFDKERGVVVLRIVYDGLPLAGKTESLRALGSLLGKTVETPGEANGRTLMFDWLVYEGGIFEGNRIRCQVITVPGQASLAARREFLLREADSVVQVLDTEESRFDESWAFLLSAAGELEERKPPVGFVVQANKLDLVGSVGVDAARDRVAGLGSAAFVGSSATQKTGIREAFVLGVRLALDRLRATRAELGSYDAPEIDDAEALLDALESEELHAGAAAQKQDEPESAAEAEAEAHAEAEAEAQVEPEPEAQVEAEPEPEAQAEAEPEPEAQAEAEPDPEAQAEEEPEPEAQAEAEPEVESEAQAEAEPEGQAEREAQAEPQPDFPAQPKGEPEREPERAVEDEGDDAETGRFEPLAVRGEQDSPPMHAPRGLQARRFPPMYGAAAPRLRQTERSGGWASRRRELERDLPAPVGARETPRLATEPPPVRIPPPQSSSIPGYLELARAGQARGRPDSTFRETDSSTEGARSPVTRAEDGSRTDEEPTDAERPQLPSAKVPGGSIWPPVHGRV